MPAKLILDNFLAIPHYIEMLNSFPEVTNAGVRSMNDLYSGDKEYKPFIENNRAWRIFHEMVFTKSHWESLHMADISQYEFNPTYQEPRGGELESGLDKFLYGRIDVGVAREGYGINNGGRGPHVDNCQRIISGLLYFTDQSELEGGEFVFCKKDGTPIQIVPIEQNLCILSRQDKEAYHFVNPLRRGIRRFVYFSLNATWPFYDRRI